MREKPQWQIDRELGRTCPRCIEARKAVAASGLTVSAVYDHAEDFCAAQSVETFGPATYGHPRSYVQIRRDDYRDLIARRLSARTRFADLAYRQDAPGLWRIVATDTDSSVGPYYATKAELLSDLERYAQEYGCLEARVSDYKSPDDILHGLRFALEESVKLQSHYAGILNDYDGGKRLQFDSAEAWIARLNAPRDGKAGAR